MHCRYAQRSKASRLEWSGFTKEYFLKRETLANVLLLVDASVPVQVCHQDCSFAPSSTQYDCTCMSQQSLQLV
jgi:GTP-binding protein EngB required for normal cell division